MPTLTAAIDFLNRIAPNQLAADWDNVGLLLGERAGELHALMTCLTVTPESAAEAIEAGAQLIVTHHPVLFRGVKRLTNDTPEGRTLLRLIRAGVAVYSPHTAFDNTRDGINDLIARRLGLVNVTALRGGFALQTFKIVVFVPETDLQRVSDALFSAGAGQIGQYRECSFRLAGTGTFFGSEATNPTVGQKGRREEVDEWRLETVCAAEAINRVLDAMRRAHSYEEPAYDVYPLRPVSSGPGEGRLGRLSESTGLAELVHTVKTSLKAGSVQFVGPTERRIERVAIVCGAGGEFLPDALRSGAEVLLTGEVRFHDCLAAQAQGLSLILPGHYASERLGVEELAVRLQAEWPEVRVWASQRERDPLATLA